VGFQVHLSLSWGVQLLVHDCLVPDLEHVSNVQISLVHQAIFELIALQPVCLLATVAHQQLVVL